MAYVALKQSSFFQVLNQSNFSLTHLGIRQLKNILAYYNSPFNLGKLEIVSSTQLLQMEFLLALRSQLEDRLDRWQAGKFERLTNETNTCEKDLPTNFFMMMVHLTNI